MTYIICTVIVLQICQFGVWKRGFEPRMAVWGGSHSATADGVDLEVDHAGKQGPALGFSQLATTKSRQIYEKEPLQSIG